jgi:hypothetical protein
MQTLKESLGEIRDRMAQANKGIGWKKVVSFATAVGAVGAVAMRRRFLDKEKPSVKTTTRRTRNRSKR